MNLQDLSHYSVSFEQQTTRSGHLVEMDRLKKALEFGPVVVKAEIISDATTSNTYLHIVSWETTNRISDTPFTIPD